MPQDPDAETSQRWLTWAKINSPSFLTLLLSRVVAARGTLGNNSLNDISFLPFLNQCIINIIISFKQLILLYILPFFWLNNILLYGSRTNCLFIHVFLPLALKNSSMINILMQSFIRPFPVLLNICPYMVFLGHVVILPLILTFLLRNCPNALYNSNIIFSCHAQCIAVTPTTTVCILMIILLMVT